MFNNDNSKNINVKLVTCSDNKEAYLEVDGDIIYRSNLYEDALYEVFRVVKTLKEKEGFTVKSEEINLLKKDFLGSKYEQYTKKHRGG